MCGIAGIFYKKGCAIQAPNHNKVLKLLEHRGPDFKAYEVFENCTFYHSRLEIIDTSQASNQPFLNADKNQALVFNGEIFNYKDLAKNLDNLKTNGDVEVLFKLIAQQQKNCLNQLNGFFAFAFYNQQNHSLLLARDRFGVKPLYYYADNEKLAFASELKPLIQLIGKQEINYDELYTYFRLNYCAGPASIFKNIYRLPPGHFIEISDVSFNMNTWYQAPRHENKDTLFSLLNDAVKLRLQADVPVGTFLSGGLDSSIISALAKKHKPNLETFSIGFEKESFFDETSYSELVARHINSNHHVFKLKEDDFLNNIDAFLNCIDEPFADSSAFNFYILSKYTRQRVKVALSGDGADELFKGYNKHKALLLSGKASTRLMAKAASALAFTGKTSRHGTIGNKLRQLGKFNRLIGMNPVEKQQFLASISDHQDCTTLLKHNFLLQYFENIFTSTESYRHFKLQDTFDIQTVLADDMLVKADRFSMQHGIEIRNPFLDYRVVQFALNLHEKEKINAGKQKIILRNSFADLLPQQIFTRSKKGFELPLQKWLGNHLRHRIENEWLNKEKIEAEGFLNYDRVKTLQNQAFSSNPGDSAAKLWAIIVFEAWLENINKMLA